MVRPLTLTWSCHCQYLDSLVNLSMCKQEVWLVCWNDTPGVDISHVLLVLSKMNHILLGCMRDVFKTYRAPFFIYLLLLLHSPVSAKCFQESNMLQPLVPKWCQNLCAEFWAAVLPGDQSVIPGLAWDWFSASPEYQVISQLVLGCLGIGSVLVLNTK